MLPTLEFIFMNSASMALASALVARGAMVTSIAFLASSATGATASAQSK